ncbi:multiple sugar transport system permease protein [Pullulanibacillus pueri]|uniref:Spermidine/putrescine ABC transporter permease n=1 Tax=Pullulanibacillus pueri TaxID=1437324 RepID=A0A8J2ZYK2_9BACL|nr:sugar ABC transporter permease [Pullulanibacillus pueri]MBM7683550.1 multiple sugar transport system permease protein [Pullulanibacillus pueri]GGH86845.1 spermidine/putrescine ABC transporter permease [Pullulanibacillus pueri]
MSSHTNLSSKEKVNIKKGTSKKKYLSTESRRARAGYLFALPWIFGLLAFFAYPLLSSIYYSFTNYNIISETQWIGLDNYIALFKDDLFWKGISNTLLFALMQVPLSILVGVSLAILLNIPLIAQGVFRTVFFLPSLLPLIATTILWQWLLNPQFGLVNSLLGKIGIDGPAWLGSPVWSKPSLVIMTLWVLGNAVLIYLAGLQDISQEYYEASEIDGANWFQKAWNITLPLLTPVIFFNMIMGVINALQEFTLPYALTYGTGNPAESLLFYSMYLYNNAFMYMKMGYAAAMAWILFIVVMVVTLILFKTSGRWVFYQGDE